MADTHTVHEHGDVHGHDETEHIGWKKYLVIGAILTLVTGVEVAIFYIPALASVLVPTLLVLSVGKFLLVVLYFMHLKVDNPVFGRVFWGPLFLAVLVVVGMIVLFKVLPKYGVFS